ncbi:protein Lines homolog 1-like isoform X1 [Branchiostoma floridae x Branchiostoma belcheri]
MSVRKKLKGEDIVGKLDNLHSDIIANRWVHLDAQDVSQSLDLHQSCDFEQPNSSGNRLFLAQERDVCLVKLSITTILFDKLGSGGKDGKHDINKLQEICRRLLLQNHKLFECLDILLGSGDQLVAYTACNTASSVVINFPTQMQPFPKMWLSGLLQEVKQSPHSSRAVCTFDLFKLVIRAHGNSVPSMPEESDSPAVPKGAGITCLEILDENWDQLTQLYLKDCQSFSEQLSSCQPSTSTQEGEVAFLSLLSLWIECLNSEVGTLSQLHNSNVLLELVPALKSTKSSLVYVNILEVFSQSLMYEQEEIDASSETIISVSHALLKAFDDEMIERVPWQDKHVGFGGADYAEGQLVTGQKPGDWVLVRTLVLVLLKACSITTSSGLSGPEETLSIVTILQRLSSFVCKKLAITSDRHGATVPQSGPWLFELFSDQDDSMIEAMLSLLNINTAVSRYATYSLHADVITSLNPHRVFLQFLETTTWDHSILLDLLISMETSFLAYITKYLHLVITEWQVFHQTNQLHYQTMVDTCGSSNGGEDLIISNKPHLGQNGEKKWESVSHPQPDHGQLLQITDTQQSDEAYSTEKQTDDIEVEGVCALEVVTMSEFDSFDMDNTGQQLHTLDTDAVQSKNPQGQDIKHDDLSVEGEKDESFSQSSDNDSLSDNGEEESTLDKTMGVLIRLRLAVERLSEKNLFPYNVSPLLRLLTMVEAKYEED